MLNLSMQNTTNTNTKKRKLTINVKKPSKTFTSCPRCSSRQIHKIEDQVICLADACDWNSIFAYLDAVEISRCRKNGSRPVLSNQY